MTGPRKKVVGYRAAHNRIRAARGPASGFECACGCGHMAQQWALKEGAPLRYFGLCFAGRRYYLVTWSLNVDDYQPMARSCHRKYDKSRDLW